MCLPNQVPIAACRRVCKRSRGKSLRGWWLSRGDSWIVNLSDWGGSAVPNCSIKLSLPSEWSLVMCTVRQGMGKASVFEVLLNAIAAKNFFHGLQRHFEQLLKLCMHLNFANLFSCLCLFPRSMQIKISSTLASKQQVISTSQRQRFLFFVNTSSDVKN